MSRIRSNTAYDPQRDAPPPPGASRDSVAAKWDQSGVREPTPRVRHGGHPFAADLDATELDDRLRPGLLWSAKGRELSRSQLVFVSRRMIHVGRMVLVAVHLIDDQPVPLFGKVTECDYESDGLHRVVLDFLPIPDADSVKDWIRSRSRD